MSTRKSQVEKFNAKVSKKAADTRAIKEADVEHKIRMAKDPIREIFTQDNGDERKIGFVVTVDGMPYANTMFRTASREGVVEGLDSSNFMQILLEMNNNQTSMMKQMAQMQEMQSVFMEHIQSLENEVVNLKKVNANLTGRALIDQQFVAEKSVSKEPVGYLVPMRKWKDTYTIDYNNGQFDQIVYTYLKQAYDHYGRYFTIAEFIKLYPENQSLYIRAIYGTKWPQLMEKHLGIKEGVHA